MNSSTILAHAGVSKFLNPGAQRIGAGAQQFLVGAVREISLNTVTRWHYHTNLVAIKKTYQLICGMHNWSTCDMHNQYLKVPMKHLTESFGQVS